MHETFLSQSIRFYVQRDNIYLPARGEEKIFGIMTYPYGKGIRETDI